ncbi:hypothetical protein WA026_005826 [Henosepilachna vigintioctopunctata]|uniref:Epoxide hydrolase n=1 Tax=Henosepilachna vigintioctopunctata TaxID=420089 RepID=A0AAW1U391_9CUCU
MACCLLISFLVFIPVSIIFVLKKYWDKLSEIPPVPKLKNEWWGPGQPEGEDNSIKPFEINISDEVINDLHHRLRNTRPLAPPLEGTRHEYGINSNLTKEITDFWMNKYDIRQREKFLNQYPQFKTKIQGLNIHFLHVKPKETQGLKVLPLLILHGWPGSVREFYEFIPILTTPQKGRNFVFEVIAPSLPGFGFSDPAVRPGLSSPQIAVILKNLMLRLNFDRFYMQAGDWGSVVMSDMAVLFPEHVIAVHNNFCMDISAKAIIKRILYGFWPSLIVEKKYQHLIYPTKAFFKRILAKTGYFHIQATKPDTVGSALSDSPMGLAAYILEKFIDKEGQLTKRFTMEALLDNVMIYWINNCMTTAMRLYAEKYNKKNIDLGVDKIPVPVPTGCARFHFDMAYFPEALLKDKYPNLIHISDHEQGHFAALECPEVLATEFYNFIEKVLKLQNN